METDKILKQDSGKNRRKQPDRYCIDGRTHQLILAEYESGSTARVCMYQKEGDVWQRVLECMGYVGKNGLGKTEEGDRKTPEGVFTLTGAFGIRENPGTKMPYVQVYSNLYLCGDREHYNRLIDITQYPHDCCGEHLIEYVPQYNYGMFLDYNRECVYGKGSAIFLHCTGEKDYTEGCIAVSESDMITILRYAEPGIQICICRSGCFDLQ
ncbi:MAG: L,D-transpeptidase family protein [Lachnospiraceae bacterium]|nr:L,D-transpeptidase family protein [Lachnospiraceae bacterium]